MMYCNPNPPVCARSNIRCHVHVYVQAQKQAQGTSDRELSTKVTLNAVQVSTVGKRFVV